MKRNRVVVSAILLLAPLLLVALPSSNALAFKGNTHVWVAQEVLNDVVDDGMVEVHPFGPFSVIPEVAEALRNYPNEYRMGSIGPDGFPDLIGAQMTVHPGRYALEDESTWRTDDWLKHLVANVRTDRQRAFVYGYLTHAATDVFSHSYVNLYAGDHYLLTDGTEEEARHMALEEFIKEHQPPLLNHLGGYVGTPAEAVAPAGEVSAAPAAFVRDALILNPDAAREYRAIAATRHLSSMYDFWETQGRIIRQIDEMKAEVDGKVQDIKDEINRLKNRKVSYHGYSVKLYPWYCFLDPGTCLLLEAFEHTTLPAAEWVAKETIDGMKVPIEAWRGQVEEATKQYVITSDKVARELLIKHEGAPGEDSVSGHLQEWVCNWAPTFVGAPRVVMLPTCAANSFAKDTLDRVSSTREKIADKLGYLGWAVDPLIKVDVLVREELKPKFEGLAEDLGDRLLGSNSLPMSVARLMFKSNGTADGLNAEFGGVTWDPYGKGLLRIDDMATRVLAEMRSNGSVPFDKNAYPPAYDSVVFSKLALLPPSELNRLAAAGAALQYHVYDPHFSAASSISMKQAPVSGAPSPLYNGTPLDTNILFGAVASIDGSHQWQESAPAYPRRGGFSDQAYLEDKRRYGYAYAISGGYGLRFWQDCELREKVFKKIFKGPLAEGVEAPGLLGLAELSEELNGTPNFNENRATGEDPFPLSKLSHLPLKVRPTNRYAWEISFAPASPLDLVVELDSQACGGSPDQPLEYHWSFVGECTYTCSRIMSPLRFECRSASCPDIDDLADYAEKFSYCDYEDPTVLDSGNILIAAGDPRCSDIVAQESSEGTFTATIRAGVLAERYGNCLDFDGMRICNHQSPSTTLLMRTDYSQDLRIRVTDPSRGATRIADATVTALPTSLNYPSFLDYTDFLVQLTGQEVCNLLPSTLKETVPPDVTPPVLVAPPGVVAECAPSTATGGTIVVDLGQVLVSDDRDISVPVTSDAPPDNSFPFGLSVVSYRASDAAGNESSAQQEVRVVDTQAPLYAGPPLPQVVVYATDPAGTPVTLTPPVFSDVCTGSSGITAWTDIDLSALPVGETEVVWKAADGAGNLGTTTQLVTVKPQRLTCDGFLPPLDRGPIKVRKLRVIPHKASLSSAAGAPLPGTNLGTPPVVNVTRESGSAGVATDVTLDALAAGMGTEGTRFELNDEGYWQYNLSTGRYSSRGTYRVTLVSGDPMEYEVSPTCEGVFVID